MSILILGATGMLGHRLMIELSKHHEVWGTWRGSFLPPVLPKEQLILFGVQSANWYENLRKAFITAAPDVVINCIADIRPMPTRPLDTINVNAAFPHEVMYMTHDFDARLIHFSTDGVFSGKRGNYTEDDTPDATDVYGTTKRLGEISNQKHVLTLRCCPIGREIGAKKSLAEWFLAQTETVKGYSNAWFSGLTTHEIARVLNEEILPNTDLHGVYHLSGEPINKHHLLNLLKMYYNHDVEIERAESVVIDRTLDSTRFRQMTEFNPISWKRMLEQMAADNALYEGVTA